jgi:hypothetical protein
MKNNELTLFEPRGDSRIPGSFTETLPPGEPMFSLFGRIPFSGTFREDMVEIAQYSPLDYFHMLYYFAPQDRVKLIKLIDWHQFVNSVSHIEKDSEADYLAEVVKSTLGEENILNLSFNLTRLYPREREYQKTAIRLVSGFPLEDVAGIFTQYSNVARNIEIVQTAKGNGDEVWADLFYAGMHTLFICVMTHQQKILDSPDNANEILTEIIDQDLFLIAKKIRFPEDHIGFVYFMKKIREFMLTPQVMDNLLWELGYTFNPEIKSDEPDDKDGNYVRRKEYFHR